MELYERFDKLITFCDEITIPPYVRERLKKYLGYFRTQSLCDFDRRESSETIHLNWQSFRMQKNALALIQNFEKDPAFWRPVAEFVRDWPVDFIEPLSKASRNVDKLSVPDFFLELLHTVRPELDQLAPPRDPTDLLMAQLGLKYLHLESLRRASERDHRFIQQIWRSTWKILMRFEVLKPYRKSEALRAKLQDFLTRDQKQASALNEIKPFKSGLPNKQRVGHPDHDYSGRQGIDLRKVGEKPLLRTLSGSFSKSK